MRTFRIPEPREHPDGEADDAEKAVRPHRSHYQPRRATGRFTQAGPVYHRPRDLGGRFRQRLLPEERAEAAAHTNQIIATELSPRLQRHLSLYELGRISSSEWHKACAQDIAYFYEQAYRAGRQSVGDPAVRLTPQDKAIVGRLVRDEMDYLKGFGDDMDAGRGRMAYHARMNLYAEATWEAFWNGWVTGDQRPRRQIRWRFGQTMEHCIDCSRFVALGWLPASDFYDRVLAKGYAPRSGMLACQGHRCLCVLVEKINGIMSPALSYAG
jgi:hypothetical protein